MRYFTIFLLFVIIAEMGLVLSRPAPSPVAGSVSLTDLSASDLQSAFPTLFNANNSAITAFAASASTSFSTAWTFSNDSNFGQNVISTTSPAWFKNGLMASSTSYLANASTTLFTTGTFWQTSAATSTFTGGISFTRFDLTATSTGSKGINITDGCFAKNGACVGATGAVTGAITASTTLSGDSPNTHGVIVVPVDHILWITADGSAVGTSVTTQLKMGGQVVRSVLSEGSGASSNLPFSMTYSTTTATTTTITLTSDGDLDSTAVNTLIMPSQPLTN